MNRKNLKNINCPLCNSNNFRKKYVKEGFSIAQCRECSLRYVNPRLRSSQLAKLYNEDTISTHTYYVETRSADEKTFNKRLALIEKTLGKKGTLLDIGCNVGTLLFLAKEKGWECHGVDINKKVRPFFKNTGIPLKIGDIFNISFPKNSFDVIVMNDLIEHVPDPHKLLKYVYSLLKKGGFLFLATPDGGSVMANILGKHWFHLKPQEHLFYLNKQHITRLFNQNKFDVIYIKHLGRYRTFATLATKSSTLFAPFSKLAVKIIIFLHIRSWIFPLNLRDEYALIAKKR